MKKSAVFGTFVLVATALSFTSCAKIQERIKAAKKAPEEKEEVEPIFAVNTYKTISGTLDDYLEFGGDIAAVNAVDVMPDMSGKVSRILVSVGDKVKKDQVIAEVDASRAGMNYRASPVKAPISGRITSFIPTIGTSVSPAMSMAKISSTDDLEIKTSIAERFVSRIKLGQMAAISFDAFPDEKFDAKVVEVSPVLDTTSRTMAIKLNLIKKDPRIKIGMYARIHLVTDTVNDALVLPYTSVVTRGDKNFVFIVGGTEENAIAVQKEVDVGIRVDDKIEIKKGLRLGDEVIITGQTLLNNGSKINVVSSR